MTLSYLLVRALSVGFMIYFVLLVVQIMLSGCGEAQERLEKSRLYNEVGELIGSVESGARLSACEKQHSAREGWNGRSNTCSQPTGPSAERSD